MMRLIAMLLWLAGPVFAQGATVPIGGEHDGSKPVEIKAETLDIDQTAGTARDIDQMTATGNVTFTNGVEAAEGQSAIYILATGKVEMTGDVVLTQGANAIAGDVLVIDLNTGEARVTGDVRTIIRQAEDE